MFRLSISVTESLGIYAMEKKELCRAIVRASIWMNLAIELLLERK